MKNFYSFDIGNSHPHIGIFQDGNLQRVIPLNEFEELPQVQFGCASIVGKTPPELTNLLAKLPALPKIENQLFFEMPVHYTTSLGQDRLVSAYHLFQNIQEPTLLIDAGTFVTLDLIDPQGFRGGHILPGKKVLLESYGRAAQLPALNLDQIKLEWEQLPQSTEQAIANSVILLYRDFLESFLNRHKVKNIVLTGGSAQFFTPLLPKTLNIQLEPHLIHYALQTVGEKLF